MSIRKTNYYKAPLFPLSFCQALNELFEELQARMLDLIQSHNSEESFKNVLNPDLDLEQNQHLIN